jgi:hypothetical protein
MRTASSTALAALEVLGLAIVSGLLVGERCATRIQ